MRKYKAWYGVTNIFLDEVSSGSGQLAYYRQLADYVHSVNPGSAVMLNPGTYPDQQYMSVGDIVMVFENTYASYVNLQVPSWARSIGRQICLRDLCGLRLANGQCHQLGPAAACRLCLRDRRHRVAALRLTAQLLVPRGLGHFGLRQCRPAVLRRGRLVGLSAAPNGGQGARSSRSPAAKSQRSWRHCNTVRCRAASPRRARCRSDPSWSLADHGRGRVIPIGFDYVYGITWRKRGLIIVANIS